MNHNAYRSLLLLMVVALFAGCSQNTYSPVSGKVTFDGQPVPSITVVFTPVGSPSNPNPGPYSSGVTDAQGVFSLKTRHGVQGAVPGPHRVGIEYGLKGQMSELRFQLSEADDESRPAIEQRIDELKILIKSRVKVPANVIRKFAVPKRGTALANFELNPKQPGS